MCSVLGPNKHVLLHSKLYGQKVARGHSWLQVELGNSRSRSENSTYLHRPLAKKRQNSGHALCILPPTVAYCFAAGMNHKPSIQDLPPEPRTWKDVQYRGIHCSLCSLRFKLAVMPGPSVGI
jgi:hypothetical protein